MLKPWTDLKGQNFRVDVGTSTDDALNASSDNASRIYLTSDGDIVMNGVQFTDMAGFEALKAAFDGKFKDLGEFEKSGDAEAVMAEWSNVFGETAVFFTYRCTSPNARTAFVFQSLNANVSTQYLFLAGAWYRRTVTANNDKTTTASTWSTGIMDAYTKTEVDTKVAAINTTLSETATNIEANTNSIATVKATADKAASAIASLNQLYHIEVGIRDGDLRIEGISALCNTKKLKPILFRYISRKVQNKNEVRGYDEAFQKRGWTPYYTRCGTNATETSQGLNRFTLNISNMDVLTFTDKTGEEHPIREVLDVVKLREDTTADGKKLQVYKVKYGKRGTVLMSNVDTREEEQYGSKRYKFAIGFVPQDYDWPTLHNNTPFDWTMLRTNLAEFRIKPYVLYNIDENYKESLVYTLSR